MLVRTRTSQREELDPVFPFLRRAAVGEQDSVFHSGPLQQNGIRSLRKSRVERTDKVEVRDPQADSTKDAPAEVLIANQPEHPSSPSPGRVPSTWRGGRVVVAGKPRFWRESPGPPAHAAAGKRRSARGAAGSS